VKRAVISLSVAVGLALSSTVLASCSSTTGAPSTSATGAAKVSGEHAIVPEPVVYSHRGASGYRPEHTLAAYRLAVKEGADYIEPDLVMTRDGVLVDRHEPEIGGTTDVAAHPEFAARRKAKMLDGTSVTGWWVQDFTLAELKTLRAKERLPQLRPESAGYDGKFEVPTLDEVLDLREQLSAETGRTVGVIPEIKHSFALHEAGFDPEKALMKALTAHRLNRPDAPLWVQSFELAPLVRLDNELGYRAKLIFLVSATGSPYDLKAKGDPRTYSDLLQPASLSKLADDIDGLGVDKRRVIPLAGDGTLGSPTSLVADAHKAGLEVVAWTFRAENSFLPVDFREGSDPAAHGRMDDEVARFLGTGVDGIFCDQPDICVAARKAFLAH